MQVLFLWDTHGEGDVVQAAQVAEDDREVTDEMRRMSIARRSRGFEARGVRQWGVLATSMGAKAAGLLTDQTNQAGVGQNTYGPDFSAMGSSSRSDSNVGTSNGITRITIMKLERCRRMLTRKRPTPVAPHEQS